MKLLTKYFTAIISIVLVITIAVFPTFAATYFSDGNYTFYKNNDNTITIAAYDLENPDMIVPESIFNDTVVAIDAYAFNDNDYIENALFPSTVKSLGNYAFNNASNLKSVNIPEKCTSIGKGVFQTCASLTSVTFDAALTKISDQMFYKCRALESIELPLTVESIGSLAFANCSSLKSITIPRTTTSIASNAFANHSDELTIFGYINSYAQEYANANDINFVALLEYEIGDVDLNGRINIKDATAIQMHCAQIRLFTDEQLLYADMNSDEYINVSDATAIQYYLVS